MKHLLSFALTSGLVAVSVLSADAGTLTFDDLDPSPYAALIPDGYQGFDWRNFAVTNGAQFTAYEGVPGFLDGVVSGPNVAFNADARDASFSESDGGTFTLTSLYLTEAGYSPGNRTEISAYGPGISYSEIFAPTTVAPTLEVLNWIGVTSIVISDVQGPNGTDFAVVDNIVIGGAASVPGPPSLLLSTIGGPVALFGARLQRHRASAGRRSPGLMRRFGRPLST